MADSEQTAVLIRITDEDFKQLVMNSQVFPAHMVLHPTTPFGSTRLLLVQLQKQYSHRSQMTLSIHLHRAGAAVRKTRSQKCALAFGGAMGEREQRGKKKKPVRQGALPRIPSLPPHSRLLVTLRSSTRVDAPPSRTIRSCAVGVTYPSASACLFLRRVNPALGARMPTTPSM